MGLPKDIYAVVDSYDTASEIWLRVQQMMKGFEIGTQEKKAKLFNECERFTSTDGESIESYYGSAEVQHYENCYNNEIFNMFTQKEQNTELLDPINEPHVVQQNNSIVIFVESTMKHSGGTIKQHPATIEETYAYFESLYNNLVTEVKKVKTVTRKMKEMNADLTTKLAKYRGQEKSFEINKGIFNELEIGYK
nr:hypothetical protein [Tanacetum cinerariifolium]